MKNKNKVVVVGVVILLLIMSLSISVNVGKTLTEDLTLSPNADCSVTVEYYGYFEGERVSVPIASYAPWSINNVVVTDLGVTITWEASGQYMDWATLQIGGSLKLEHLNYVGAVIADITSRIGASTVFTRLGTLAMNGTASYTIPLATLLSGLSASGVTSAGIKYWTVKASTTVSGQCTDNYGKVWTDSTGTLSAIFTIYDAASGFDLSGSIG